MIEITERESEHVPAGQLQINDNELIDQTRQKTFLQALKNYQR